MPKIMQNLIALMEPSKRAHDISLKGGHMSLNRCCIDEDAAFELSGVHYLNMFDELSEVLHLKMLDEERFLRNKREDLKGKGSVRLR